MWRGHVSRREPRPHPKGRGLNAPRFWGFLSIYAYTLCRRTTKSDAVTRGEGRVFWGQPPPSQESGVSALPGFRGSLVFMPTSFNTERPNSAW